MVKYGLLVASLLLLAVASMLIAQDNAPAKLQKMMISSSADVQQLIDAGAEIIVQQPDYVIFRGGSAAAAQGATSFEEVELVQRFVHIALRDSGDVQTIVDMGVDLWDIEGETVVGQAYDLYINRLKKQGFDVKIMAMDAKKRGGKK